MNELFTTMTVTDPSGVVHDLKNLADYIPENSDGFGMAPFARIQEQAPLQHGVTDLGFRLAARRLRFKLRLRASSPADHFAQRAELLEAFKPYTAALTLAVTVPTSGSAGDLRYLSCYLEDGLRFTADKRRGLLQEDVITFEAPDPTFYDPTARTASWVGAAIGGAPKMVVNPGTWLAFPTIQITGPVMNPTITNLSLAGLKIQVNTTITAGQIAVIDLAYGKKTITLLPGSTSLLPYLSTDSDLAGWRLDVAPAATGGANNILAAGTGTTGSSRVDFSYYARYIGL